MAGSRRAWAARLASLATALAAGASALPAVPASGADGPVRIMLVGDSMTEGSSGDWTWRYRLAGYLDDSGVDYEFVGPRTTMLDMATKEHTSQEYADPDFDRHHFARWGESLHAILNENASTPQDSIGAAVSSYQPDVVIEVLGINDLLYGSSPEETLSVAHTFVDEVRAAKSDATLVMSTVPGEQYAHVADYNDLLSATAPSWSLPASPVLVSDPAPGWSRAVDTCDGTHPSATGEVQIAAAQQDALATIGIGSAAPRPLPTPPAGPRLPAVLDATRGDGQAFLTWQLPPGGTAVLISTRNVTTGSDWRQLPIAVGGTSWTSGGLRNGDTHEYRLNVLKHDCLAADVTSDVAQVTPEPDAPGSVPGVEVSPIDHGVVVAWSTLESADSYSVWVKAADAEGGWTTHTTTADTVTVSGLEAGRPYDVAVQAVNAGGAGPLSPALRTVPTGVRPAAPQWLRGTGSARGSATVTWSAVPGANSYRLAHRVARPGARWRLDPQTFSERSTVIAGLRDGLRYVFRVRAANDRVLGPWSKGLVITVPRVGPVRHVVARVLRDGRVRTRGSAVRDATSYTLTSVATHRCGRRPGGGRFHVVSKGLAAPRHTFSAPRRAEAVWVRWRAAYDGVGGRLATTSTTCVSR